MNEKILKAAKAAHEINRIYCEALGDNSQPKWEDAPDWQKESIVTGINFILNNPDAGPDSQHICWLEEKRKDGWVYGEIKDPEKKTHPCMVEYDELPVSQRIKDMLFGATVRGVLSEYM